MKTINIWKDTRIQVLGDVYTMFRWCTAQFGDPGPLSSNSECKWSYGKSPDFTGSLMVHAPEEIEWFDFVNDEDATAFMMRFG